MNDKKLNYEGIPILTGVQPDHHRSFLTNFENRYDGNLIEKLDCIAGDIINDTLDSRYIFLCGTPGSGKTHFLVGLFRAKALKDDGVIGTECSLYIQFPSLITEIIEGFRETPSTRLGLAKYLTIKYLFIDDISKGERVLDKDKMESQVFRDMLLDRFENKKYLIATSNYSSTELKRMIRSVFGDYVISRVASSGIFIDFPKTDFRKKK